MVLEWAPSPVTAASLQHRQRRRGEGGRHWSAAATSQGPGPPEPHEARRASPPEPADKGVGFLGSGTVIEYVSTTVGHQVCGNLFWQPLKIKTLRKCLEPALWHSG